MAKVKRSEILTYINVTPSSPAVLAQGATATYVLLGPGVTTGEVNMNPKSTSEIYLADDTATTTIDSYGPTMPIEQTAIVGDKVFDFIDALRIERAILGAAETTVVNVWNYETGGPGSAKAEEQIVSIQVESIGDAGGQPVKINYTINYIGNPAVGTFNTSSKAFTKTP